jgi:hypothetical protein
VSAERGDLIIPVILSAVDVTEMPPWLNKRQWIDLRTGQGESDIREAGRQIAEAVQSLIGGNRLTPDQADEAAQTLSSTLRATAEAPSTDRPDSVFLVHGHDEEF